MRTWDQSCTCSNSSLDTPLYASKWCFFRINMKWNFFYDVRISTRFCDWKFCIYRDSRLPYLKTKWRKEAKGIFWASNGIVWTWRVNESAVYRLLEDRSNSQWGFRFPPSRVSCVSAHFLFALSSSGVFARSSVAKAFMQIAVSLFAEAGKCLPSRLRCCCEAGNCCLNYLTQSSLV